MHVTCTAFYPLERLWSLVLSLGLPGAYLQLTTLTVHQGKTAKIVQLH